MYGRVAHPEWADPGDRPEVGITTRAPRSVRTWAVLPPEYAEDPMVEIQRLRSLRKQPAATTTPTSSVSSMIYRGLYGSPSKAVESASTTRAHQIPEFLRESNEFDQRFVNHTVRDQEHAWPGYVRRMIEYARGGQQRRTEVYRHLWRIADKFPHEFCETLAVVKEVLVHGDAVDCLSGLGAYQHARVNAMWIASESDGPGVEGAMRAPGVLQMVVHYVLFADVNAVDYRGKFAALKPTFTYEQCADAVRGLVFDADFERHVSFLHYYAHQFMPRFVDYTPANIDRISFGLEVMDDIERAAPGEIHSALVGYIRSVLEAVRDRTEQYIHTREERAVFAELLSRCDRALPYHHLQ